MDGAENERSVELRLAAIETRMTSVETRLAAGDERMAAIETSQHGMQRELAENTRVTRECLDGLTRVEVSTTDVVDAFDKAERAFRYITKTGNAVAWVSSKLLRLAVALATIAAGAVAFLHYLRQAAPPPGSP